MRTPLPDEGDGDVVVDVQNRNLSNCTLRNHNEGVQKLDILAEVEHIHHEPHVFLGRIVSLAPEVVLVFPGQVRRARGHEGAEKYLEKSMQNQTVVVYCRNLRRRQSSRYPDS